MSGERTPSYTAGERRLFLLVQEIYSRYGSGRLMDEHDLLRVVDDLEAAAVRLDREAFGVSFLEQERALDDAAQARGLAKLLRRMAVENKPPIVTAKQLGGTAE